MRSRTKYASDDDDDDDDSRYGSDASDESDGSPRSINDANNYRSDSSTESFTPRRSIPVQRKITGTFDGNTEDNSVGSPVKPMSCLEPTPKSQTGPSSILERTRDQTQRSSLMLRLLLPSLRPFPCMVLP